MSERIATQDDQDNTLKVSPKSFVNYLNRHNADAKCAFCLKGEYEVGYSPSGESTAVVAAPVPNQSGMGLWLYPASCNLCGHTIFFNAFIAAKAILKGQ